MERKILNGIEARVLAQHELAAQAQALELLNRTQGVGLFGPSYLAKHLQNPRALVTAAFTGPELVGISVVELLEDLSYFFPFDPKLGDELLGRMVGAFTTLSVRESFQGKGVGQLLSRIRLDWLAEQRCNVALGVSWMSGLPHTSNRTFEKAGFRAVRELPDFYHASSIKMPFDCPGCHRIPCACGAILYRKDF